MFVTPFLFSVSLFLVCRYFIYFVCFLLYCHFLCPFLFPCSSFLSYLSVLLFFCLSRLCKQKAKVMEGQKNRFPVFFISSHLFMVCLFFLLVFSLSIGRSFVFAVVCWKFFTRFLIHSFVHS